MPPCNWKCKRGKRKGEECGRPASRRLADDESYICGSHLAFLNTSKLKNGEENVQLLGDSVPQNDPVPQNVPVTQNVPVPQDVPTKREESTLLFSESDSDREERSVQSGSNIDINEGEQDPHNSPSMEPETISVNNDIDPGEPIPKKTRSGEFDKYRQRAYDEIQLKSATKSVANEEEPTNEIKKIESFSLGLFAAY